MLVERRHLGASGGVECEQNPGGTNGKAKEYWALGSGGEARTTGISDSGRRCWGASEPGQDLQISKGTGSLQFLFQSCDPAWLCLCLVPVPAVSGPGFGLLLVPTSSASLKPCQSHTQALWFLEHMQSPPQGPWAEKCLREFLARSSGL